jgi:hypothetical protein
MSQDCKILERQGVTVTKDLAAGLTASSRRRGQVQSGKSGEAAVWCRGGVRSSARDDNQPKLLPSVISKIVKVSRRVLDVGSSSVLTVWLPAAYK